MRDRQKRRYHNHWDRPIKTLLLAARGLGTGVGPLFAPVDADGRRGDPLTIAGAAAFALHWRRPDPAGPPVLVALRELGLRQVQP